MFRRACIPLPLEGFGVELLDAQAERCGLSVARFMERAAERYVAEPDRAAPSRRVPAFLKDGGRPDGEKSVEVELDPDLWDALEREAQAQGVGLELIVAHAAMLLAADLNR
jgi:hypothetical protein